MKGRLRFESPYVDFYNADDESRESAAARQTSGG